MGGGGSRLRKHVVSCVAGVIVNTIVRRILVVTATVFSELLGLMILVMPG